MSRHLSTAEVSRILGMQESRIRELARVGLCRPQRQGRAYAFSFQDLVVLRTAEGLLRAEVPAARVRRALLALMRQLPPDRPLSGLRIYAEGSEVVVRDDRATWLPESGQLVLDFETDELARLAEAVRKPEEPGAGDRRARAEACLQHALDLEDEDQQAARAAYREALELDPDLTDAYVNLGRLAQQDGDPREAARLYALALARSPNDPIIHFNLALALEDTQGPSVAAHHYERALELDPEFADAHYNLAGLCEQLGRQADALRHYHAYKKLTRSS